MTRPLVAMDTVPVEVLANGQLVETVAFSVVGQDSVSAVELFGESDADAEDNDLLAVLAEAFDADGESIWGVAFDWDLDGEVEPGEGDLFRYWFEPDYFTILGAEYEGHRSEITIQGVEGFVSSSNDAISCFCRADQERPSRGVALGLMCLLGLGLVRRPRARRAEG